MEAQARAEQAQARAQQLLARKLAKVHDEGRNTRTQGLLLPIVDADPPTGDPTNIWGFDDGRIRWRGTDGVVHEVLERFPILTLDANPSAASGIDYYHHGTSDEFRLRRSDGTWARYAAITPASAGNSNDPGGSTTQPKTADPKTHKHTLTVATDWARTLCPNHGVETGGTLYYGRWSSTHGRRRIMLGFDDTAIRSTLNGAVIREVYVKMRNAHSNPNSGIDVHFGGHKQSNPPGGYSSVRERVWKGHWPKSGYGTEWRRVPDWFGKSLRDDKIRGLIINQPSDSSAYYGAMDPGSFRLRIVYTHQH